MFDRIEFAQAMPRSWSSVFHQLPSILGCDGAKLTLDTGSRLGDCRTTACGSSGLSAGREVFRKGVGAHRRPSAALVVPFGPTVGGRLYQNTELMMVFIVAICGRVIGRIIPIDAGMFMMQTSLVKQVATRRRAATSIQTNGLLADDMPQFGV